MFPEETHVKILKRIDAIEAEMFGIYRKLERLRLDLQQQWRALPSGARWSERSHAASEFSVSAGAQPREE